MPRAPRRHGTRSCHVGGCRRPECVEANRAYLHDYYQVSKPYLGGVPNVDTARARKHIETLRATGMGADTIALDAGVRKNTVLWIARGQRTAGIRPETERRILAVRPRPQWVDSTGTERRLRALAALGYSFDKVAAEIGLHQRSVSRIACGRHETVRRSTADRVTHLYDQWSMTPGPSSRVRGFARAKGWPPPLAWNDDAIDNPTATPLGVRDAKVTALDLDEWLRLVRYGEHPDRAAERCGVKLNTVQWYSARHGRSQEYVTAMERSRERWAA